MSKKHSKNVEMNEALETPEVAEQLADIPEEIIVLQNETSEDTDMTAALLDRIAQLEADLEKAKKDNKTLASAASNKTPGGERKSQVLQILRERGPISIKDIANIMSTSTRNVSSVLTAIRNAGFVIHTDNAGQKYIVSEPETTAIIA